MSVADIRALSSFLIADLGLHVAAGAAIEEVFMFASASLVLSASMLVQSVRREDTCACARHEYNRQSRQGGTGGAGTGLLVLLARAQAAAHC